MAGRLPKGMASGPTEVSEEAIQMLRMLEGSAEGGGPKKKAKLAEGSAVIKGKTLAEIESEEGGPVKESLLGMAQVKRAQARKAKKAVGDTDLVEDTEQFEQQLDAQAEADAAEGAGGTKLEPFNLSREREEGYIDEEGNYVRRKDDDNVADAWLDSEDTKLVSEAVRRKIEQQQAARQAAEEAPVLSELQIAVIKREMAALLQPGENVVKALKRLGGGEQAQRGRAGKRARQQKAPASGAGVNGAATGAAATAGGGEPAKPEPKPDRAAFERLTELADTLLTSGELDAYSCTKASFEADAAVYLGRAPAAAPDAAGPSAATASGGGRAVAAEPDMFADDADDDMFAEDDTPGPRATAAAAPPVSISSAAAADSTTADHPPPEAVAASNAPATTPAVTAPDPAARAAATAAGAAASSSAAEEEVDYSSWPIKELRRFLSERGQDSSDVVEKPDLVARVRELAAQGPQGDVPPGYVYDPQSGYFYCVDTNMYYDVGTGLYYSAVDGNWYSFDAAQQQFVVCGGS